MSCIRVSTRIEIVDTDGIHLLDVTVPDTVNPGEDRAKFAVAARGTCEDIADRVHDMLARLFGDPLSTS